MTRLALACVPLLFFCEVALAEVPFQFTAPNLRSPDDPDVDGMRISILHGENQSVRGFDLGLISMSETHNLTGFSGVFGIGRVTNQKRGVTAGLVNLHSSRDSGLNAAFINRIQTMEKGANIGFVNIADGYTMVDVGGINTSDRSTVQLGFVNVTREIESFQLGFINVAENGFLPIFPFFNFPKQTNADRVGESDRENTTLHGK